MTMLKRISIIIACLLYISNIFAQLSFSGSDKPILIEEPESSTGLDYIYVIYNTQGVSASYIPTTSTNNVVWSRYSNLGGAYAEQVDITIENGKYILNEIEPDMGYIIEDGSKRLYFWIVNYADHHFSIDGLGVSPESDCSTTYLAPHGNGNKITYYTINGQAKELNRNITVSYNTLIWDKTSESYTQHEIEILFPNLSSNIHVPSPLCDTNFTIYGDRFLIEWGESVSATSDFYKTPALDAETSAMQEQRDNDNEQDIESGELGGSAPVEIHFKATCTDNALFTEWQFSKSEDFEIIDMRYNDLEFDYTFQEQGSTFIRFVASNDAGTCDYFGTTYVINIGESDIKCPNAFSPGATEGINDEWKISYKSIISFECHIFNRWGVKVAELTDPSMGWDGKHNGKLVPAGVYYYIIKAKGADGKDYDLNGDINIIKYNQSKSSTTTPQE